MQGQLEHPAVVPVYHPRRRAHAETLIALLVSGVFMVIAPGVLMGRLQSTLQRAEQRASLQTFRLKNLLPDEAKG